MKSQLKPTTVKLLQLAARITELLMILDLRATDCDVMY